MKINLLYIFIALTAFLIHDFSSSAQLGEIKTVKYPKKSAKFEGNNNRQGLSLYLLENTKYPSEAASVKLVGDVRVKFKVLEDGSTSDIKVVKGLCSACDEEAIRVINEMPHWNPASSKYKINKKFLTQWHPADPQYFEKISIELQNYNIESKQKVTIKFSPLPEEYVYSHPDSKAKFVKSESLEHYIESNSRFPITYGRERYNDDRHTKKIILRFKILKDGSIDNVVADSNREGKYKTEAIRLLKLTGKWNPAMKFGLPVNSKKTLHFSFTLPEDEIIFMSADVQPEFIGGVKAFKEYLTENISYPSAAKEANISGSVYVKFVVRKDGSIYKAEVLMGIGGGCDEEALRVIKKVPIWKPGELMGKPINVWYTIAVRFTLPQE